MIEGSQGRSRLIRAGWLAVMAGGMGFALRGGLLLSWGSQYDLSLTALGQITGCGLAGFAVGILFSGINANWIDGRKRLAGAIVLQTMSLVVLWRTESGPPGTILGLGLFIFGLGSGMADGAARLTAAGTRAEWLIGVAVGTLAFACLRNVSWQLQISSFLPATVASGILLLLGWKTPPMETETVAPSLSAGPLLVLPVLLAAQAMQGWMLWGVASWLAAIAGRWLGSATLGLLALAYMAGILQVAHWMAQRVRRRVAPLTILAAGAGAAWLGLMWMGRAGTMGSLLAAVTVFAGGAAASGTALFSMAAGLLPGRGAMAGALMTAVGMLAAGLLGAPALGYAQETHTVRKLMAEHPRLYQNYKSARMDHVLIFYTTTLEQRKAQAAPPPDRTILTEAEIHGGEVAFRTTAVLPLMQLGLAVLLALMKPLSPAIGRPP